LFLFLYWRSEISNSKSRSNGNLSHAFRLSRIMAHNYYSNELIYYITHSKKLVAFGAWRRHSAVAALDRHGAAPAVSRSPTAEPGRARPSAADSHAYFATRRATVRLPVVLSCFSRFFAPLPSDHPRFVRVNAHHLRPTGDGASARLPLIVKAPKTEAYTLSALLHARTTHARTYVTHVYTHIHTYIHIYANGWCMVCSCRWCSTGEEAWSVFSAPVSNRHGPLPQPRTQQGELRLVTLYSLDWSKKETERQRQRERDD